MIMPLAEMRNLQIENSLTNDGILGDVELLKQALMNVIINAIQAVNDGGKIHIQMRQDEGFVVVDVKDNGLGIKRKDMERIFDPFFSTKETGTGLGLTIVLKIMQNHGGHVRIWSEEGKGSQFSLYFPSPDSAEATYES